MVDSIRFLAITDFLTKKKIKYCTFIGFSTILTDALRSWCVKRKIIFLYKKVCKKVLFKSSYRIFIKAIPHALKAFAWLLFYLTKRCQFIGLGLDNWKKTKAKITFFSYSDNIVAKSSASGRYESNYWGPLPALLRRKSIQSNWLHIYIKDNNKTSSDACQKMNAFNKRNDQCHVFLDTFLSINVICQTLTDYFHLFKKGLFIKNKLNNYNDVSKYLLKIHRLDFINSLFGADAMSNLLTLNMFESALNNLPHQSKGVYLQENQPWEFLLIHAWRKAGHGPLIGNPHSTISFWDFRYFSDSRNYKKNNHYAHPLPDMIACNGPVARSLFEKSGYSPKKLVNTEALRYITNRRIYKRSVSLSSKVKKPLKMLVLTDYKKINTQRQLELLRNALKLYKHKISILIKPHPNCPIKSSDYPWPNAHISSEPVTKLLYQCDIAYASVATSAAVEAYCAGVPIIIALDPNLPNLSPLRDCKGAVYFVNTPTEFLNAMQIAPNNKLRKIQKYFYMDSKLTNWKKILFREGE